MTKIFRFLIIGLTAGLIACEPHSPHTKPLNDTESGIIRTFLHAPGLENASVGILIENITTGELIDGYRPGKSMVPASVLKVLTSAAALETFGPGHTFTTSLAFRGDISGNGTLNGDIIITGSGDPAFMSPLFEENYSGIFADFADAIKKAGIKNIQGNIVGDGSYFGPLQIPDTWIWEDIGNYYGAPACGLNIFDNSYQITFSTSGKAGTPARILKTDPPMPWLHFENRVTAADNNTDNAYIYGTYMSNRRIIKGTIPKGKKAFTVKGSVSNPALLTANRFLTYLEKSGIKVSGKATSVFTPEKHPVSTHPLAEVQSPPLSAIIGELNHKSINLYAETLLLHLAKYYGEECTVEAGCRALQSFWENRGMDISGMFLEDGSGLSRANVITPGQLLFVLKYMKTKAKYGEVFLQSLPVAGISGSLKSFGMGTSIEGHLRAKSGYMTRVMNYAGYLTTASGQELAFAVMINHYSCSNVEMRKKLEKLLVEISLFEKQR